ncbi:hypothetical protein Q1W73_16505 [Asticcacaulis sp. ZE23SCel15]|uniref:hypothetical protein n=1 Tax=Asticcacaulis sp. ZE23SCel15 TaxID=3059027 RepID=UPI0026603B63|nr:hypothetical protein [Asticcacaulis sp. ZE23SCel15]WKL57245.1 hypothetical protein Q1W73_16505 [Asticcacaulis sp. ZE23SCel15]
MFDGKAFGDDLVGVVRLFVAQTVDPLRAEIKALRDELSAIKAAAPQHGRDGRDGVDGADGKDADIEALKAHLETMVAGIKLPENGKNGRDGVDGRDGSDGRDGVDGTHGKDGIGLAGAVIDREGRLTVTLTNGEMKALGVVVGRDGVDGANGDSGRDGFSLNDFDAVLQADGRTLELSFTSGDTKHTVELAIPVMIYRGVYQEGRAYEEGDTVTFAGSLWHCNGGDRGDGWKGEVTEKPADGVKYWTLATKRGRDGKDFKGPVDRPHVQVKI